MDESEDFSIVGVGDVQRLQEEITHLASAEMEPALRPHFLVDEIDGEIVAAVEVEEISAAQKPCFYKQAGLQRSIPPCRQHQPTDDRIRGVWLSQQPWPADR